MERSRRPSPQTVAVLLALGDRAAEQSHGYDLCRALDLRAGTVYPILRRLDDRGLVETRWEPDPPQGRPARHLYRLSATGVHLVAELRRQRAVHDRSATVIAPRPVLGDAG